MFSKHYELEEIVDDVLHNTIIEALGSTLESKKECDIAIEILREKLATLDDDVFDSFFDK
jgi:hypothetical protein